jgi:hypothetical protein
MQPQPLSRLNERLKKSIGRKVCLMFTLLAVSLSQVPTQQVSNPPGVANLRHVQSLGNNVAIWQDAAERITRKQSDHP